MDQKIVKLKAKLAGTLYELLVNTRIDNVHMLDGTLLADKLQEIVNAVNAREKIVDVDRKIDAAKTDIEAATSEEVNQLRSDLNEETAKRKAEIAVERERINQFTRLEEGSTTGDAELIDARVDYNGETHTNVGDHIRSVSGDLITNLSEYILVMEKYINLFDKSKATDGEYYKPGGGKETVNGYIVSSFIPFEFDKSYKTTFDVNWFPNYFSLWYKDGTQANVIGDVPSAWKLNNASPYKELKIPSSAIDDGKLIRKPDFIRFAFYNLSADSIMVVKNNEYPSAYIPFGYKVEYAEELDKRILSIANAHDFLYGKKWVACGDSFTAGDFADYTDDSGNTGKQSDAWDNDWNMWKTYPYWIGKRHNMTIVNEAISGSVMVNKDGQGANQPFSVSRYLDVPTDADYITIAFGLNENSIITTALGTKNDTTNQTLWGAYNKVFEHFYRNMPYAKVGVILNDSWLGEDYKNAVKEICAYWGIPWIDLGASTMPLGVFQRTSTEVSSVAQNLRNEAFYTSPTNGHPNVKAHSYRSTYIEEWLRTL